VLDTLPGEFRVKPVRPLASSAAPALVAHPQLEMALVTEHHMFPFLHTPVRIPPGKLQPVILHSLGEKGLVCHLAAGQLQLLLAETLDGADAHILQLRDVLLQVPGGDAGVPRNPLLDLPDGTKGDFGGSASILAFLGNGILWVVFCIG
jgi:hypothetical protein